MDKIIREAKFVIDNDFSIRRAAELLGISKSVLHRHLTVDLKKVDYDLYLQIKNLFLEHNKVRHINGGISTRLKYLLRDG